MSLEHTMELNDLREQVRALQTSNTRAGNFLEALAIVVIDEEDWEEAAKMLREATGRPPLPEDKVDE